jgi:ribonuclease E
VVATNPEVAGEETAAREGSRRRGRRGGRRERERRDNLQANGEMGGEQNNAAASTPATESAPAAPKRLVPSEYVAFPNGMVRPTEYLAMPTIVPVVAKAVAVVAAPVAAATDAGLTQIETDPSKAAKIAYTTPHHAQSHAPRRRERKREVYVEEPLVQIETQHPAA